MTNLQGKESIHFYDNLFSERIRDVPRSFIREILKVTESDDIISFAGGLPNPDLFPVQELKEASAQVFTKAGKEILQYSTTEGYRPLREYIANRYWQKQEIIVSPDNILITSGSQQGLDLLGKTFINMNDGVVIEEPGYLGAIQAFSVYQPNFLPVSIDAQGIDTEKLSKTLTKNPLTKLMYTVPEFQNPSGLSYTNRTREEVVDIVRKYNLLLVEDNPYTDLRFSGNATSSFYKLFPERTILLGTFSKTVVPSFRLGWLVAPDAIMEKLVVAKQAADLHSNYLSQRILFEYLSNANPEKHISNICEVYGRQSNAMVKSIGKYFPKDVSYTVPEGGMFLWVTLPAGISSMDLFNLAIVQKVAFVPGNPFYTSKKEYYSTLRLNYSCANEAQIEEGIMRLGMAIQNLVDTKKR